MAMVWQKQGNTQVAQGVEGKFTIERIRGYYRAKYEGVEKTFNFPKQKSIKDMKKLCEDNFYWE